MLPLRTLSRCRKRRFCDRNVSVLYPIAVTGEISLKEVTAVFVREIDHINYLTIEDENGNIQTFEVTDAHPFWVVTDEPDLDRAARGTVDENGTILYHENLESGLNGFWVEAKDLQEGDVFLGANGELLTFVSNERIELDESIKVYNFTVEDNHNYFVIAATDENGQTCVLVHNKAGIIPQSQWYVKDENGKEYTGSDATSLLELIKQLDNNNTKILTLIIKGHSDDVGIVDNHEVRLIYSENGWFISIGGQDVTKIMRNITDNNTSITLRGCSTKPIAKSVAKCLPGVHTSGTPIPVIGIPYTTYIIGPWRNYCFPP